MADVKWIKLKVGMFDGKSFKKIKRAKIGGESYRDKLTAVWFELMDFAGKCNHSGAFIDSHEIPFSSFEDIAIMIDRDPEELELCMRFYINEGMIDTDDGIYMLSNWSEYQNEIGLEEIRKKNRDRQAKFRAKKQLLLEEAKNNVTDNVTVMLGNAVDIEEEREKDLNIKEINKEKVDFKEIVDLFHSICKSFSSVRSITENRKKALRARLNTYKLDDFRTLFEKAEASAFLKGSNDRNWTATFDWLIKDANMAKVLEGNYDDKPRRYGRKKPVPGWLPHSPGQAELDAIKKVLSEPVDDTANDPEFAARAEEMEKRMQEKYGKK
jgi:predicted phage replisome organizer